jgi:hypothetical protein
MQGGLAAALLAGEIAAFLGALIGVLALTGVEVLRPAVEGAPRPPLDVRLTVGAFLLAAHALTAASLLQAPKIGACLAAALGAGWMGAAAAGAVVLTLRPDRIGRRAAAAALRAAMGFALLSPLWAYVQLIRLHAMGQMIA